MFIAVAGVPQYTLALRWIAGLQDAGLDAGCLFDKNSALPLTIYSLKLNVS